MKNMLYQMKDIMEKFNISRDCIKYYEKKGLITPLRNEAQYRLYDEKDIQKLKMIMDLRELGFSIEEVETQMKDGSAETALEVVEKLREEMEAEIVRLNNKLIQIDTYEKWTMSNAMYLKKFKIDTDYKICCGCEHITPEMCRKFYVRDIEIVYLDEEKKVVDIKEEKAVLLKQAEVIDDTCKSCKEKRIISFKQVYRGVWRTDSIDKIEAFLNTVYEKAECLGYSLQKVAFCTKRNSCMTGENLILLDICIPFEE